MRAIHVNKFNHLVGGADKYFLEVAADLPMHGVATAKFCMAHPDNLPDEHEKYFVSQVDFNRGNLKNKLKAAARILWSGEAARKFEQLIKDFKPDLVHLHNIYHQISPSILPVAKRHKLPVIMHLHDYKYLCPNYKMYNRAGVCERCRGGRYYNCARYKCLKDSRAKSALAAAEMYWHHKILKVYEKNVDLFLAPTEFVANKYLAWGGDPKKIRVRPYFLRLEDFTPEFKPGDYFLYFGRLGPEKGIMTLLKAMAELKAGKNDIKLKIVGNGELEKGILRIMEKEKLGNIIELVGPQYSQDLKETVKNAFAVIVPSEWYEVSGIVILEASAMGKPVIGARIGGISENIIDCETGLLFKPGDVDDLAEKLSYLWARREYAEVLGRAGHDYVRNKHSEKVHLTDLTDIYKRFLSIDRIKFM